MKVQLVDLSAQHTALAHELEQAIAQVVAQGHFILGTDVELFEQEFAAYCGAEHAVGVDCGLSALEMLLHAHNIGPGDEVILPANTFIATALAVSSVGARPVLVDVDPLTYLIDVEKIEAAITRHTKAIIPVHLYGQVADMDAVRSIADRRGLILIEDACQAHGARYKGRRAGTLSHGAAFSFYPAKNLGALGDGGMVVTDDAAIAEKVRLLRNYGARHKYYHEVKGHNHRLDTIQAAILRVKLKRLDLWNENRRRWASIYSKRLSAAGIQVPVEAEHAEHVYHLYVIRAPRRDSLAELLRADGIATGIHYPLPIHLQPVYTELKIAPGSYPITEQCAQEILSLPMYPELSAEEVQWVAERVVHHWSALAAHEEQHALDKII